MPDSAPLCGVFGRGLWGASHLHNGVKCLEGNGLGAGDLQGWRSGRLAAEPLPPSAPQRGENSVSSSLVSSQRDHGGLGIWEAG